MAFYVGFVIEKLVLQRVFQFPSVGHHTTWATYKVLCFCTSVHNSGLISDPRNWLYLIYLFFHSLKLYFFSHSLFLLTSFRYFTLSFRLSFLIPLFLVFLSIHLSVSLSICLSVCLFLFLFYLSCNISFRTLRVKLANALHYPTSNRGHLFGFPVYTNK
jgi:hypothetical protein